MARAKKQSSFNDSNFGRLRAAYSTPSGQTWPTGAAGPGPNYAPAAPITTTSRPWAGQTGWAGQAGTGVAVRPFTAAGTYDKVALLALLTVVTGVYGYFWAPQGVGITALLAAFVTGLVGSFVPRWARVAAPAYAAVEGIALGWISAQYATVLSGIVPDAILFTGGVFIGTWAAYRTGLIKVTPRFMVMTLTMTAGLALVCLLSMFGLPIPGVSDLGTEGLIFGVIALLVAVFNLFVDFAYVERAAAQRLSAEGEWYAAFAIMLSLVLVYLSVLRILAAAAGGGRR